MRNTGVPLALCGLVLLLPAAPLHAQAQNDAAAREVEVAPLRPLRIAKWTSLTGTAGLALYGFTSNRRADELYESIERVCETEPQRCTNRSGDGAYADAALESDYQRVRGLDRRARSALIGSQIGLAASAILFLLDLRNQRPPDNIPYEPRRFDVGPARAGGVGISVRMPAGRR